MPNLQGLFFTRAGENEDFQKEMGGMLFKEGDGGGILRHFQRHNYF